MKDIHLGYVNTPEERDIAFQQYRMIFDSVNQLDMMRETSNQFWLVVNTAAVSGISYLKGLNTLEVHQKTFFLITLLSLGFLTCWCWMRYLWNLGSQIDIRLEMLKELETYFPVKAFIKISERSQRKTGKGSLTIKELSIPVIFIMGYFVLGALAFFFPTEVLKIAQ